MLWFFALFLFIYDPLPHILKAHHRPVTRLQQVAEIRRRDPVGFEQLAIFKIERATDRNFLGPSTIGEAIKICYIEIQSRNEQILISRAGGSEESSASHNF